MIHVEGIGKRYQLGVVHHNTLRESVSHRFKTLFGGAETASGNGDADHFWALKDVTFDVAEGEVVGIIGRNGAGKSTLLKILSRITPPTEGRIRLKGRVASLLEVGTGFHPELTGRENIFLNGAILGMSKREIRANFDEIIAFSEVEKFIDTPVKHYSSGMHVRLAFAVAAHLEPEILIVDEVLAVGDISFQKKCMGKMTDAAQGGRTVLFVSHNMAAVQALCNRAVILKQGMINFQGVVEEAVTHYASDVESGADMPLSERKDREGNQRFRINAVRFSEDKTGAKASVLVSGMSVLIECDYETCGIAEPIKADISIGFYTESETLMFACRSSVIGANLLAHPDGGTWCLHISKWPLNKGRYRYSIYSESNGHIADWIINAGTVLVETGDFYGTGKVPAETAPGMFIDYLWENKVRQSGHRLKLK